MNEVFSLRDYQKNQVNFLWDSVNNNAVDAKNLFKNNISLCSPTGSGKSITMLKFIQEYFKYRSGRIFISTGFNELVYQFYETAKTFNIPCTMLIGKNNCACYKEDMIAPEPFGKKIGDYNCNTSQCRFCKFHGKCHYDKLIKRIKTNEQILVITNHSTLLSKLDFFQKEFIGGFLDECQSFPDFYRNYKSIEITLNDVNLLIETAIKTGMLQKDTITYSMLNRKINTGKLTKTSLLELAKSIDFLREEEQTEQLLNIKREIKKIPENLNGFDCYCHPQTIKGKFVGVKIDFFFNEIDLKTNVCITSATIDSYTKNLFKIFLPNSQYEEKNCNIIDYSKSNVYIYQDFSFKQLESFVKEQTGNHGLFLSTRLDLVRNLKEEKFIFDYKITTNRKEFEKERKAILVGSKSLFQGIDLGKIDFVMLNKTPFPKYDDLARKQNQYFLSLGKEPYKYYTIPYTINQLTQCMGRLWRKPEDKGNVAIFDSQAKIKYRYILNSSLENRKNINLNFKY